MSTYDATKLWVPENLTEILNKHIEWVEDRTKGQRADLSHADLRSFTDVFAKYAFEPLRFINFKCANLEGIDFPENTYMTHSNFESAKLDRADLSKVNLKYSNFYNASLQYADLRASELARCNFKDANMRDVMGNKQEVQTLNINGVWFVSTGDEIQIGVFEKHPIAGWRDYVYADIDNLWVRGWLRPMMPTVETFLETLPAVKRWLPVEHDEISEAWKSIIDDIPIKRGQHDMYEYLPLEGDENLDVRSWWGDL